ncbi:MAG: RNA polymerase sigma factor RpoH [Alphaproteobacteria bacterium]|nr:RNA polymerase sigma factor RpoH [Alphaproteobacteria bacterium]
MQAIRRYPMLEAREEFSLAKAWKEHGDLQAAHKLVTSHLRLVAKIAMGYRGYGLPLSELIAEGNIGMMQAVKRFDPDKGFRLATYAMWWIRASIQEYVLHAWSLVKIGTTAAQKKLFFNLRRIKHTMRAMDQGDLSPKDVETIAKQLAVSEQDVVDMDRRLSGPDLSLNAPLTLDGEGESQWQDLLADERDNQEQTLSLAQQTQRHKELLTQALSTLNERERDILIARRLSEPSQTLEDLSQKHNISRERIRQIETRAFEKIKTHVTAALAQEVMG